MKFGYNKETITTASIALFFITLLALFILFQDDILLGMKDLIKWMNANIIFGVIIMISLMTISALLLLPIGILTTTCGLIFTPIYNGLLVIYGGYIITIILCFIISQKLIKNAIQNKISNNKIYCALNNVVANYGFKVVLLARFSQIPFGLLNYIFSNTKVTFWKFFAASLVGLLPMTIIEVFIGSMMVHIIDGKSEKEALRYELLVYLFVACVGVPALVSIIILGKKEFRNILQNEKTHKEQHILDINIDCQSEHSTFLDHDKILGLDADQKSNFVDSITKNDLPLPDPVNNPPQINFESSQQTKSGFLESEKIILIVVFSIAFTLLSIGIFAIFLNTDSYSRIWFNDWRGHS
jgi:uncharacterized membrane protein YdjX (TVP38/TMEM64 family)